MVYTITVVYMCHTATPIVASFFKMLFDRSRLIRLRPGRRRCPFGELKGGSFVRTGQIRIVSRLEKASMNRIRLPLLRLLLSKFSRKGWMKFGQKSLPISKIAWTLILSTISVCCPTPGSVYVVCSGPLWPTFNHLNQPNERSVFFPSIALTPPLSWKPPTQRPPNSL